MQQECSGLDVLYIRMQAGVQQHLAGGHAHVLFRASVLARLNMRSKVVLVHDPHTFKTLPLSLISSLC